MSESMTVPYRRVLPLDRGGPFEVWRIEPCETVNAAAVSDVIHVPSRLAGPPLALKCLPPEVPDVRERSEALRREARLQDRVHHPGIVPVELVEIGQRPAIVTPLAWGSLDTLPEAHGTRPPFDTPMAVRRLADALTSLHAAGIVHGDVAPTNVLLLTGDEAAPTTLALTDFGCATELGEPGPARGTPGVVAPEVAAGHGPSPASDVYGLGRVGHVLLSTTCTEERAALESWCANLSNPDPGRRPSAAIAASTVPFGPRARTVEFGPRPHPPEVRDATCRRTGRSARVGLALLVVLMVAVALVEVRALGDRRASGCSRSGPPGWLRPGVPRRLDVLHTGCAQQVTWSGTVLTVRSLTGRDVHRFRVGRPGDQLAIVAWGCTGTLRPTLYRPGRGEVLIYSALPTRVGVVGAMHPTRRFGLVTNGRARLSRDPHGCYQLEVTDRDPEAPPGR